MRYLFTTDIRHNDYSIQFEFCNNERAISFLMCFTVILLSIIPFILMRPSLYTQIYIDRLISILHIYFDWQIYFTMEHGIRQPPVEISVITTSIQHKMIPNVHGFKLLCNILSAAYLCFYIWLSLKLSSFDSIAVCFV